MAFRRLDFTLPDYFLFVIYKEKLYKIIIFDNKNLAYRITAVCRSVTSEKIDRFKKLIWKRIYASKRNDGRHLKQFSSIENCLVFLL